MNSSHVLLFSTVLLLCSAVAVPKTQAAADSEPHVPLVARAESLSKADTHHAAQREIGTALKWIGQAEAAHRVGQPERLNWLLFRAQIQLTLAERLIALSKLRHRRRQLVDSIKDLRRGTHGQVRELEERKAFLQALRDMR